MSWFDNTKVWKPITDNTCPACGSDRLTWGRWGGPHQTRRRGACLSCWQKVQQSRAQGEGKVAQRTKQTMQAITDGLATWLLQHPDGAAHGVISYLAGCAGVHRSTVRDYLAVLERTGRVKFHDGKVEFAPAPVKSEGGGGGCV